MQTKLVLKTKNFTDKNGYTYQQVEGDETGVRIYRFIWLKMMMLLESKPIFQ